MTEPEIVHLRNAITVAWSARRHGNHPFGAVLVDARGRRVLLRAENTVVMGRDLTGHAEMVRLASPRFRPRRWRLTLYASAEPCAIQ
ncbi:MAG: hypothetical protein HGA45_15740 [Chloroflexales bacterium]|nr:hypothetical protein [Chloroflexales bacterium]